MKTDEVHTGKANNEGARKLSLITSGTRLGKFFIELSFIELSF